MVVFSNVVEGSHAYLCYCVHVHVGPAGTGKTESVKALGHQLGRFVLVFNCDETFDFQVCLPSLKYQLVICVLLFKVYGLGTSVLSEGIDPTASNIFVSIETSSRETGFAFCKAY